MNISKADREAGVSVCPRLTADSGIAQSSTALKPRYSSESKHLNEHKGEKGKKGVVCGFDRSHPILRQE